MLKVHTTDGHTAEVDLQDEQSFREWMRRFNDPRFQATITGLTVVQRGVQYSLPRPKGFRDSAFIAEPFGNGKGGERVFCFADQVRVAMTVHNSQRSVRVAIDRPGKRKFQPG